MITAGISSSVFAAFPVWYKLPLTVQHNMAKLTICSSMLKMDILMNTLKQKTHILNISVYGSHVL